MSLSTFGVAEKLGIRRERFREWMLKGYIKPSIQETYGQRTKSIFSDDDVLTIQNFTALVDFGLSRECAARIVNNSVDRTRLEELIENCR